MNRETKALAIEKHVKSVLEDLSVTTLVLLSLPQQYTKLSGLGNI
jgi:hypothetical protein